MSLLSGSHVGAPILPALHAAATSSPAWRNFSATKPAASIKEHADADDCSCNPYLDHSSGGNVQRTTESTTAYTYVGMMLAYDVVQG